jgi:hypothetical protein
LVKAEQEEQELLLPQEPAAHLVLPWDLRPSVVAAVVGDPAMAFLGAVAVAAAVPVSEALEHPGKVQTEEIIGG